MSRQHFTITRTFDAARVEVWTAWTDIATAARWWHPNGMQTSTETATIDLREGGAFTYTMTDSTGAEYPFAGTYLEVRPIDRLRFTWGQIDATDTLTITVDLADADGRTAMTFHVDGTDGHPGDDDVYDGWDQAFTILDRQLWTRPSAAIEALAPILGRWRSTGDVYDADGTIVSNVEGTDCYTLLPGGRWIAHDVDVVIAGERTLAHEIIGGAGGVHGWIMHAYGDGDEPETMRLTQEEPDLLLLHGDGVRSWFTVLTSDGAMRTRWERHDGHRWNLWMDMYFTPIR